MKQFLRVWKYFWPAIKPRQGQFWGTLVAYAAGALVSRIYIPIIYSKLIDTIVESSAAGVRDDQQVYVLLLTLLITFIILNIFFRIGDFLVSKLQSLGMRDLYNKTLSGLLAHSYTFFANTFTGSLVAKTKRFVNGFETICDRIFFEFWFATVIVLGIAVALFIQAPVLGVIVLVWVIAYLALTIWLSNRGEIYRIRRAEADSHTTGALADILTNIFTIKSFASVKKEQRNFSEVVEHEHKSRLKAWYVDNERILVLGVVFMGLEVGGMIVTVKLWMSGAISPGTVVLVQLYFANIFSNVWNLGKAIMRFNQAVSDCLEVVEILEAPVEIVDSEHKEIQEMKSGGIEFKNVDFVYQNGAAVFNNLNLIIPAGQKVGIVGHSGAGKSTITKLLLRFADVTEGAITIDGQDIRKVTQDDLRSAITYVPQEPLLFHRSIYENIAYGNPDASKEEVEQAAKSAHAHEFIEKLQEGYSTLVGERGVKLSGGERQRVAIARAMMKDAPILILDEATSSLDSESEAHIQEALSKLIEGKTALVIAHRLSTIQKMDRILVFEEGEIVEDGTHAELIKKGGVYANLWNRQVGGFIAE